MASPPEPGNIAGASDAAAPTRPSAPTAPNLALAAESTQLRCHYFEAWRCRSCSLIETPYPDQLAAKEVRCRTLLPDVPEASWLPTFSGGDRGFRNRVKLVVGGERDRVTLGILGPEGLGIDLRECAIQAPGIAEVIPHVAEFVEATGLDPYSVPERRGELKFVHITEAPDGALMLRFVVRSEHGLERLRSQLAQLLSALPRAVLISVNLLPEHKAVLEGEREEVLFGSSLTMRLGGIDLHLLPQSFFQTNTAVAQALYAQAADWVRDASPASVWDLYCGVGGFALHAAAAVHGAEVVGVELSEAAVQSAVRSAREAQLSAAFVTADATEFALGAAPAELPELVIVNPPRRGIGPQLAEWLERSGVPHVVYSSCNPDSLAKDLAAMPSYRVLQGRVFDMFPHTAHLEVAVRLERVD